MANKCRKVEVIIRGDVAKVLKDVTAEAAKHDLEIKGDTTSGTIKHKTGEPSVARIRLKKTRERSPSK